MADRVALSFEVASFEATAPRQSGADAMGLPGQAQHAFEIDKFAATEHRLISVKQHRQRRQ
jgi:hypothetical protein